MICYTTNSNRYALKIANDTGNVLMCAGQKTSHEERLPILYGKDDMAK